MGCQKATFPTNKITKTPFKTQGVTD
uniref:Uncharacterized protein n=1 Tax=Rhizophora mucronata TaxID=61149 RepID=A0A2P2PD68_RHIMU